LVQGEDLRVHRLGTRRSVFQGPAQLYGVDSTGTQAWFHSWVVTAVHDLERGVWLARGDIAPSLAMGVCMEANESASVAALALSRSRRVWDVVDYPDLVASSQDGRWVWVEDKERSGGVYDAQTGIRVFLPVTFALEDQSCPTIDLDTGTLRPERHDGDDEDAAEDDSDRDKRPPNAITRGSNGAWHLVEHGVVARDGRVLFRLPADVRLAVFDAHGVHLAVVREPNDEIVVLAIGEAVTIASRHRLG
jgi:hypothetical protein